MARKQGGGGAPAVPADDFAEAQAVGAMLGNNALVELSGLSPSDFYNHGHRSLFSSLLSLKQAGAIYSVSDLASSSGVKLEVIQTLSIQNPDPDQFKAHVTKIKELASRRKIIGLANRAISSAQNTQNTVGEVVESLLADVYSVSASDTPQRLVVFEDCEISVSSSPIYKMDVRMGEESRSVSFDSETLDNRDKVRRKLRECFHCYPILPADINDWQTLLNSVLARAKKIVAPEETSEEQQLAYWIREWRKVAAPAEEPEDLTRGYVVKDGFVYFQPERLRSWISNYGKFYVTSHVLWTDVKEWGGTRRAIRICEKPDSTRRMWGLPADFFTKEFAEEQPEEVELDFLEEVSS